MYKIDYIVPEVRFNKPGYAYRIGVAGDINTEVIGWNSTQSLEVIQAKLQKTCDRLNSYASRE